MKTIVIGVGAALALASYAARPGADIPPDSPVAVHASAAGAMGKAKHAVGTAGSWAVGGLVTSMTDGSDHEINSLNAALKKKQGPDGKRARDAANSVTQMNSLAREYLHDGRPVAAVNTAMRALDYLGVAKRNLANP